MTRGVSLSKSALHAVASCNSLAKLSIVCLHCDAFTPHVASSVWVILRYDFEASKNPLEVWLVSVGFFARQKQYQTYLEQERKRMAHPEGVVGSEFVQEACARAGEVI
jgi:hypothetical protein